MATRPLVKGKTMTVTDIEGVRETASTLYLGALENDGATVWITAQESTGYLVGVPNVNMTLNANSPYVLRLLTNWVTGMLSLESEFQFATLGSWVNHLNDGAADIHFDACEVYFDRDVALGVAKERGEIAIWDVAKNEEITV